MKINRTKKYCGLALAALLIASASQSFAQTADVTIQTFDAGSSGSGIWYGNSAIAWDSSQDNTGNGGGSLYVSIPNDTANDTPLNPFICMNGGNPWYNAGTVDLTLYKSIEFDIKWDNSSALTLAQFNDCSTWPATYGTPVGQFNGDPSSKAFNIKAVSPNGPSWIQLGSTNIPALAASGWAHVSFPIDITIAGLGSISGIDLEKWNNNHTAIVGPPWPTANFWIDNIILKGTAGPPPPPTVKPLAGVDKGLQVSYSTSGSLYDRQSVYCISNTQSWYGVATGGNPVSYSFTISSFPTDPASSGCEAWFFLDPNPTALANAPDWNEPNMIIAFVQQINPSTAIMHFQYKANEPSQQAMYSGGNDGTHYYTNALGSWDGVTTPWYESGDMGSVTNPTALGTWTIRFTSNTNITIIAPGGDTTNVVIAPYYASYMDPGANGLRMYLGGQANNTAAYNQKVVYSHFSVTGTAAPINDNFLTDATLNTNLWSTSQASGPGGVLVVPTTAKYWVSWTLPASGYSLEAGNQLTDLTTWTSPSVYPVIPFTGQNEQLVDTAEVPAGPNAFFNLIKRAFTQMQVLLPGETAAPGTPSGKTGTPTAVSLGVSGGYVDVTVNAVDPTWHKISGITDQVTLSTTDGSAILPAVPQPMANGSVTISGLFAFQTPSAPTYTVTATDASNGAIPTATSAAVTVNP